MAVRIADVIKGSYAYKKGIKSGDILKLINGKIIEDVLDYQFYIADKKLDLSLSDSNGKQKEVSITKKDENDEVGLVFSDYLMDKERSCENNCIFCFIDQMPKGLRESLYFKDDDSRLSFLFGNYITLTNITRREIDRIKDMHISPVNISVHTMNPKLRVKIMRNKKAGESLLYLKELAAFGTKINTQIVVCPGINDGEELLFSLTELGKLYPSVESIAVVPVGLTCHREGLYKLNAFTEETARQVIDIIDDFNAHFVFYNNGYRLAFASDELYLTAKKEIPSKEYYGDFNQYDNGVGMIALLKDEFIEALSSCEIDLTSNRKVTIATGEAAFPLLSELSALACNKYQKLKINTVMVKNKLFGESVTVAGLLSGKDIMEALLEEPPSDEVLIPLACLRFGEDLFLDGLTLDELSKELSAKITPVENVGNTLLQCMLGIYRKGGAAQ